MVADDVFDEVDVFEVVERRDETEAATEAEPFESLLFKALMVEEFFDEDEFADLDDIVDRVDCVPEAVERAIDIDEDADREDRGEEPLVDNLFSAPLILSSVWDNLPSLSLAFEVEDFCDVCDRTDEREAEDRCDLTDATDALAMVFGFLYWML